MRIVDLYEVKEILGITTTTYDNHINRLLPIIQEDVIEYLNNYFPDKNTRYHYSGITFINADPPQITDTQNQRFSIEGFAAGMDIAVEGTYRNKGIYTIATGTSETLTLAATDKLLDETSSDEYGGNYIMITRCNYPKGLKLYIAQILWENIKRAQNKDIKSKTLGPSSVVYESVSAGGYSKSIIAGLNKYRRAKIK